MSADPVLVVDAANVVGSRPDGWWRDRAGAARSFVADLTRAVTAGTLRPPVVVVLEGHARPGAPPGAAADGIEVVHAPGSGDDAISDLAARHGREAVVVTADRALAARVRSAGAEVVGPRWLLDRIAPRGLDGPTRRPVRPEYARAAEHEFVVRAIGIVRSTRTVAEDDDWDAEHSSIELIPPFDEQALRGLDAFSHCLVVYMLDRAQWDESRMLRHPRGNDAWPEVGVFAQRAKDRPNRLGVTTCHVVGVEGAVLHVGGLDAIDGTPVVDIKPHMHEFGPRSETRQPAWADELMRGYW